VLLRAGWIVQDVKRCVLYEINICFEWAVALQRLRSPQEGQRRQLTVYGFGQQGASLAFMAACDEFVYLDDSTDAGSSSGSARAEMLVRQGLSAPPPPSP